MENEKNKAAQPEQTVMFQIVLDKSGNIGIGGIAVGDKTMAYGLLEAAKDILRDMHQPKLIKPTGGIMNFVKNGRHQ